MISTSALAQRENFESVDIISVTTKNQKTQEQKESEDQLQFVFDSNLPDTLYDFYNQEKIRTAW